MFSISLGISLNAASPSCLCSPILFLYFGVSFDSRYILIVYRLITWVSDVGICGNPVTYKWLELTAKCKPGSEGPARAGKVEKFNFSQYLFAIFTLAVVRFAWFPPRPDLIDVVFQDADFSNECHHKLYARVFNWFLTLCSCFEHSCCQPSWFTFLHWIYYHCM